MSTELDALNPQVQAQWDMLLEEIRLSVGAMLNEKGLLTPEVNKALDRILEVYTKKFSVSKSFGEPSKSP